MYAQEQMYIYFHIYTNVWVCGRVHVLQLRLSLSLSLSLSLHTNAYPIRMACFFSIIPYFNIFFPYYQMPVATG
uniref:Uncharacterized protein n=1 Tax=Octopus bimaculoides TaxID=37653 RepID=A0A0L8HRS8_OCTBM